MSAVLTDGTVLLVDGFGLTRLTPSNRPKTLTNIISVPGSPIVVSESSRRVWVKGPYSYNAKVLDTDTLKSIHSFSSAPSTMLPDGEHVLRGYSRQTLDGQPGGSILSSEAVDDAPAVAPLAEAGSSARPGRCISITTGPGHLLIAYRHDLVLVPLEAPHTPRWKMAIETTAGSFLIPHFTDEGLLLVSWLPIEKTATLHRRDLTGRPLGSRVVPMLAMPAVCGDRIVYQSDLDTVCSASLDGASTRQWSIKGVTQAARETAKKPLSFSVEGVGQVLAGKSRTLFVPWHGESILDLTEEVEIFRKLRASEAPLRAALSEWIRDNRSQLDEHGLLNLIKFDCRRGSFSFTFSSGSPNAPSRAVSQTLLGTCSRLVAEKTGLRVSGYGSGG